MLQIVGKKYGFWSLIKFRHEFHMMRLRPCSCSPAKVRGTINSNRLANLFFLAKNLS